MKRSRPPCSRPPQGESPLALGVDLGSSGLRLVLLDPGSPDGLLELSSPYPGPFEDPESWREGLIHLIARIPRALRGRVEGIAIDGTSGTLLLCRRDGRLLEGELALALPYHRSCPEQIDGARALLDDGDSPAASASGSLARALHLLERASTAGVMEGLLLRHQADWLMGWLLGDWRSGEEGNNLRLGWSLRRDTWQGSLSRQSWASALPGVLASGTVVGPIGMAAASALGLPSRCQVVAGSTDANAAVLSADPADDDGVTILGTTIVLKRFVAEPIEAPGVSCHRVAGRWLVGGASNAGAGIFRRFFSDGQIAELSRQIDPDRPTGIQLRPLLQRGERFPLDDPELEPVLDPRPISDALFLQALLEALTEIERVGWERLQELGAPPVQRVITLGGGARNPQWRQLRQRALGVPVLNRPQCSSALGMARLAGSRMGETMSPFSIKAPFP